MSEPKPVIQKVRGMQDFLPNDSEFVSAIEANARKTFSFYDFKEIRIPVLESSSLFKRAIGETTDIVEKEMFSLTDRGERELCMRPEGTAGVVRSYIENNLGVPQNQKQFDKLFYVGPMFRAERPQAGRYREFNQIGAEYFGDASPSADVEVIKLALSILGRNRIEKPVLKLNSIGCSNCRPGFQKKLIEYLNQKSGDLCKDCQRRMAKNPLRVLDCKTDAGALNDAPKSIDNLCAECRRHHQEVEGELRWARIEPTIDHRLVRGLDYYNRTVFEFYAPNKSGSQDALGAGGRYDYLVEMLGGRATPAVGFAIGLERVMNLMKEMGREPESMEVKRIGTYVAWLGLDTRKPAFQLVEKLRDAGIPSTMSLDEKKLDAQMKAAGRRGMRYCVIIGEDEIKKNKLNLKDLRSGAQMEISDNNLIDHIRSADEQPA